jgi:hypothetical protein
MGLWSYDFLGDGPSTIKLQLCGVRWINDSRRRIGYAEKSACSMKLCQEHESDARQHEQLQKWQAGKKHKNPLQGLPECWRIRRGNSAGRTSQ